MFQGILVFHTPPIFMLSTSGFFSYRASVRKLSPFLLQIISQHLPSRGTADFRTQLKHCGPGPSGQKAL